MALGITKVTGTITGLSSATVSAGTTTWGTALNAGSGERYRHVVFTATVTFNGSATGDAVIHMRKSANDGTTKPGVNTDLVRVTCNAGNAVAVAAGEAWGFDYLEMGVEDEDGTYDLTSVTVTYEGEKVTGMS